MPKELIFGSDLPYTEVSSAHSVIGVHWGNEMDDYLQVSTQLVNDDGKYADGYGAVHVAEGAEAERRHLWGQGFYVNLDRKGVNALIRHLRRARDQAFGRDE
jgi:hypothetical protein